MVNAELIEKAHALLDCGLEEETLILWEILDHDIEYLEPNEDGEQPQLNIFLHHFKEVTDKFYWDWEVTVHYNDPEEGGSSFAMYPLTQQQVAELLDGLPNRDDGNHSSAIVDRFLPFVLVADHYLKLHSVPSEDGEPVDLTEELQLFIRTRQDIFSKSDFWNLKNFSNFCELSAEK
jgi:hypothetical protein